MLSGILMAEKQEQEPEAVTKYYKLKKKVTGFMRTVDRHHRQAYDHAVDEVLGDITNLDDLDDSKKQLAFADEMSNFYVEKAKKYFKTDKDLDELEKELLVKAYANSSKQTLRELVKQNGGDFEFDKFYVNAKQVFIEPIRKQLTLAAGYHIKEEHLDDIIKYTNAGELLKRDYLDVDVATDMLDHFKKYKKITPAFLKDLKRSGKDYVVKQQKEKKPPKVAVPGKPPVKKKDKTG